MDFSVDKTTRELLEKARERGRTEVRPVGLEAAPLDVDLGVPLVTLRLAVERLELLLLERVLIAEHALMKVRKTMDRYECHRR